MYTIEVSSTVPGSRAVLWETWTDMPSCPTWDPREEQLRLDAPFAVGATGFSKQVGRRPGSPFTVTRVDPQDRWTIECPLPGGRLVLDHLLETSAADRVRPVKRYEVHGPMAIAFRLVFARGIRAEMPRTFAALAGEAERRARAGAPE